jgi:hypothetical protein
MYAPTPARRALTGPLRVTGVRLRARRIGNCGNS